MHVINMIRLVHRMGSPHTAERAMESLDPVGCRIIQLPKISDARGNLTFVDGGRGVPFDIKRVYYLYDVPGGETRGGHAHYELEQLIIAVSGSFDVVVDNGFHREKFSLNRSYFGLYMPQLTWREIENFSSGSVCLVLASRHYDEADYIREYGDFQKAAGLGT